MFNSKKPTKPMSASSNHNHTPSVNILSKGTILNGDIKSDTDIRIAGTVEGEARTDGKIIMTASGKVAGNLSAKEADIAGTVDGEIKVSARLTLRSGAVVEGNIYTKTLIVEEGAQINGICKMGSEASILQAGSDRPESEQQPKVKNVS